MKFPLPISAFPLYSDEKYSVAEFERLAFADKELPIEREPDGSVVYLLPVGGTVGHHQAQCIASLGLYARTISGMSLSSRTGYLLPDTSVRMGSASFISPASLSTIGEKDLNRFIPLAPDFVVEIVSSIRTVDRWQQRMQMVWIANGIKLAWLADVDNDRLWIYRADHSVELVSPLDRTITGEDVLPGFTFDLNLLS